MPPKTVRFTGQHSYQSAPPSPISPSYSSSSSASATSSNGPYTPPSPPTSLPDGLSTVPPPFTAFYGPAKPTFPAPAGPHPLLELSIPPPLEYDLRLPPATLTSTRFHNNRSMHPFTEAATTPALPFLQITSPYLPWTIAIHPQPRNRHVTVEDVIHGIHRSLRENITQMEFDLLPTIRDKQKVSQAYERRYQSFRRGSRAYKAEKQGGVKRVDFLRRSTRFMGLSPSANGTWVMTCAQ